ncbi:MAG: hypothetical protein DRJ31_10670 [Candidatus Methanomethylicota archaeon]|uniref:Uncharacterized protein n=1 Tax=Thermoproteota archaeon TaxID=2056631 RepID=A0A497EJI7_9CREN|nr:MAG: hypothetical protein DRJ31_10670 [Candidatus Verstraetearchaeota archaeon]
MREKIRIEITGPETDYATYTGYLWLIEIKPLLEEEFQLEVEIDWVKKSDIEDFPIFSINRKKVFEGLPGEAFYLYEIIKSFLERKLRE